MFWDAVVGHFATDAVGLFIADDVKLYRSCKVFKFATGCVGIGRVANGDLRHVFIVCCQVVSGLTVIFSPIRRGWPFGKDINGFFERTWTGG